MTDTLKTVLVNAMNDAKTHGSGEAFLLEGVELWVDDNMSMDADRLATAIRDHVFDREKVRAALVEAMNGSAVRRCVLEYDSGYIHAYRPHRLGYGLTREEVRHDSDGAMFKTDDLIDRLIEGLTR